jgi:hypothetical protein
LPLLLVKEGEKSMEKLMGTVLLMLDGTQITLQIFFLLLLIQIQFSYQ